MNDLTQIKDELNSAVDALTQTAKRLKVSAQTFVNKRCEYENKKNQYVLQLKAEEETSGGKIKRTDAVRQSMYRLMYQKERLEWLAAEMDYETDKDLYKGLIAKLNALQTVARLTETEMKLGESFQ